MSESLTIPGLTDDEQGTLDALWAQFQARLERNLLRASFYDGKRAGAVLSRVVPDLYNNLGIVLGWCSKSVDKLVERSALERMTWADGSIDEIGYPEFADENALRSTIKAGQVASAIHGPSFLINTVGAAGEPASMLHVKDAMSATGLWNRRRRALDAVLSIHSWEKSERSRPSAFTLYLDDVTVDVSRDQSGWSVERSSHSWGVPVEVMLFKPHTTSRDFGSSRITRPMMAMQEAATRSLIRMEGHLDVYSYPEFVLVGAGEEAFKNADGSPRPDWQMLLGRIKAIPDDENQSNPRADVKHFQAASPEPHLAGINAQAKLFAREADLDDSMLAITDFANPTSEGSYTAAKENLIALAESATDDWSLPVRRAVARGLAIKQGLTSVPAEWATIATEWRSPAFLSRSAAADAGSKQLAAVPWLAETRVGLKLLGLSEQDIDLALAERQRSASRANVTALAAVAQQRAAADAVEG